MLMSMDLPTNIILETLPMTQTVRLCEDLGPWSTLAKNCSEVRLSPKQSWDLEDAMVRCWLQAALLLSREIPSYPCDMSFWLRIIECHVDVAWDKAKVSGAITQLADVPSTGVGVLNPVNSANEFKRRLSSEFFEHSWQDPLVKKIASIIICIFLCVYLFRVVLHNVWGKTKVRTPWRGAWLIKGARATSCVCSCPFVIYIMVFSNWCLYISYFVLLCYLLFTICNPRFPRLRASSRAAHNCNAKWIVLGRDPSSLHPERRCTGSTNWHRISFILHWTAPSSTEQKPWFLQFV